MKAIVQTEYGSPDVLSLAEVDPPEITDNGVLVSVLASSANAADWHLMRGSPFLTRLIFSGILKPKIRTLGCDIAGRVEAVGKNVTQFQAGDEVFGELSECGFGAFAEYVCAQETVLVLKPNNLSFEAAATIPNAGLTALQALRDCGRIQAGQQVLINGASSGVGSFAVQMAKAWGAEVTGVCQTQKIAMVRSLGADQVIDYTQTDITQNTQRYDLILDAAAYRSCLDYRSLLMPKGTYVLIGGSTARLFQVLLFGGLISKISGQTFKALVSKPKQADLIILKQMAEAGQIVPFIDRTYRLSEVPAAIRHLETRQVQGKVAIQV
jgi:NADPH:quinone reductase-like Zn-dependent oxidoreductase